MRKFKEPIILQDIRIVDCGAKGEAIGKKDDFVILLKNAVPGDIVTAKLLKKKKGFAEGALLSVQQYSPDHVSPVCSHFYNCGGCNWQNLQYESQLAFKQKWVKDTLRRIGHLDNVPLSPIIGCDQTYYYRNRLDFGFSDKRWRTPEQMHSGDVPPTDDALGFHVTGKFDKILEIDHCYLQPDPSNLIRLAIGGYARRNNYPFYNLREHTGSLRSLIIRTSTMGGCMVIVVFAHETPERIEALMSFAKHAFPAVTSWYYVVNTKLNDTLYDREHILFAGDPYLTEQIDGIKYKIGPKSFFQTNPRQAETLFKETLRMAAISENDVVYDLYCGVGSISLLLARRAKRVIGIETVPEAIELARINAKENGIENCVFYASDVKDLFNSDFVRENGKPDVLVVDPPRVGLDAEVIRQITEVAPEKLVYVSCNPATQARDLAVLATHYEIIEIRPVDMFPHTYHVENIVSLKRRDI